MIRIQRKLHARIFLLLTPLLLAALAFALVQRQRAADHLVGRSTPGAIHTRAPERLP